MQLWSLPTELLGDGIPCAEPTPLPEINASRLGCELPPLVQAELAGQAHGLTQAVEL